MFESKKTFYFQHSLVGDKAFLFVPKNIIIYHEKKLNKTLIEYYVYLLSFLLKKFFIFYSLKYINYFFKEETYKSRLGISIFKRNYFFKKKNFEINITCSYKCQNFIKNFLFLQPLQKFNNKSIYWPFSKAFYVPMYNSLIANSIFYLKTKYLNDFYYDFINCTRGKILCIKNHKKITHVFKEISKKECSLDTLCIETSWVIDSINSQNTLPAFFCNTVCIKSKKINPAKCETNKKSLVLYRSKTGKKTTDIFEFIDTKKRLWILNTIKLYEIKNKIFLNFFCKKNITVGKIKSLFFY